MCTKIDIRRYGERVDVWLQGMFPLILPTQRSMRYSFENPNQTTIMLRKRRFDSMHGTTPEFC